MAKKKQKTALDIYGKQLGLLSSEETRKANLNQTRQNYREKEAETQYREANKKQQAETNKWKSIVDKEREGLGLNYKPNLFATTKQQNEYLTNNLKQMNTTEKKEIKPFSLYNRGLDKEEEKKVVENVKANQKYLNTSTNYKKFKEEEQKGMLTKYLADKERVEHEKTTTWDKLNIFRPFLARLEDAIDPGSYKLDNGETVDLPSYNELKSNKVMSEMGKIGKAVHSASGSLGGMTPSMVASAIPLGGKILGPATTFLTTQNSAYNQKLLEGYDPDSAKAYSYINAGLETGLQSLMGGATKVVGGKTSVLSSNIDNLSKNVIKNAGTRRFVSNLASEEMEELSQMVLDPIVEHITLGEYKDLKEALSTLSMEETEITALSTLLTIGITEGRSSFKTSVLSKNIDAINKQYGTNFRVTTEGEITDNKTNKTVSGDEINESIKKIKISQIQDQQLQNIEQRQQQVEYDYQNGNISEEQYNEEYDNIKRELTIFKEENEKGVVNPITEIEALKDMYQEQFEHKTITENQYNNEMNKLQTRLKEIAGKQDNRYSFTPGENNNITLLEESASKYFDNSEKSKNYIEMLKKISTDKGLTIVFDDTLGDNINGQYENGTITINPNSTRTGEFIAIHELTHAIGTNQMRKIIDTYRQSNADFNKAVQNLIENYGSSELTEEAMADVSGQLFGNQEFINNLADTNPSLFKRIYQEIKYLYHQFTGYKNQDQFIEDLQYKWEQAYRNQQIMQNNKMSFSLEERVSGDALLDAQDLIEELKSVGAEVDDDGYVTLYHQTTDENAKKIRETGKMTSKELDVFFSTSKNASQSDGRGQTKLEFKIPVEKLKLDDIFDDNADVKIGLDGKSSIDVSDYLVDNYQKKLYNTVAEAIDSDARKRKFLNHSNSVEYFNLDYEVMDEINAIVSTKAHKSVNGDTLNFTQFVESDKKAYAIYADIMEDDGYYINSTKEIREIVKEVADETRTSRNSKYSLEEPTNEQGKSDFDTESVVNKETSATISRIPKEQQRRANNKSINKEVIGNSEENIDIKNSRELDNSSFSNEKKYRGSHQIENAKSITELNINDIENRVKEIDGYLTKQSESDLRKLKKILNNPNETVKIYRASPVNELNSGDWVTTDKSYAQNVANNNGGKVYTYEVDASQLYYPDDINNLPSLHRLSSFQYVEGTSDTTKHSKNNNTWKEYLESNFKSKGTTTKLADIVNSGKQQATNTTPETKQVISEIKKSIEPVKKDMSDLTKQIDEMRTALNLPKRKTILNPAEIAKMTKEDANTTPKAPKVKVSTGDGESRFANNIRNKTNMLTEEAKQKILAESDTQYYKKVTNKESMEQALDRLDTGGRNEALSWFQKDSVNADSTDVAEGWILMKQYQDSGDYDGMVEVAKKMREIGSKAGQTVQAFNIMERMTPEGMVKYAQSELTEAYNKMIKNKTKTWIDANRENFDLQPNEVQFILDTMQEVSTMEEGYDKKVKLAEIQKLMTDKLPADKGKAIKSWMRISMLFNPKTQVRNVVGNAIIAPVNYLGDVFASKADKIIAKKTGIRTTGTMNVKAILKGMKEGAYQATNDYKLGINTKDMEGNRFEMTEGKSFNDKTIIGKSLNKVDHLLNYVMDAGDRVFSQSSFENSLQNQMLLNNTTEVTQEMIDIARSESLQRTWNDNNNYTRFVLNVRKGLNAINFNGYGLGDVLIPFAKTPANLTKAIVDYSPVGLVNALTEGKNLSRSLSNGQYNAQLQHDFVQRLGKATAGTMLYILGYALAKSGVTSGESDDDKDTANFLKNTLGVNSYSIKIGNKSFTYDWAQPLAAPISIMSNIVNSNKNKEQALLESVVGSLDTAGSILLEQSFLQSLNDVLSSKDGIVSGLISETLELPSRAIPTFMKQIADLTDKTQRTSYEYGKPIQSAINSAKAKIPGLNRTLAPSVDTMGREIQRYGGKNNIFNVFLNPANVATENISTSAQEIYRLYQETGDKTIMPRVSPSYINQKGEKTILNSNERAQYQKVSGKIIEQSVREFLNSSEYQQLNDVEKADMVKKIVDYSYNKARKDVLGIDMASKYNKITQYVEKGGKASNYYLHKEEIDFSLKYPNKYNYMQQVGGYENFNKYKTEIEKIRKRYKNASSAKRKSETIKYVNSLKLNVPQKAMLIRNWYSSYNGYNSQIYSYINSSNLTTAEKLGVYKQLDFKVKGGRVYW